MMTNEQKIKAYDRTLKMLIETGTTMEELRDSLNDHGLGSLDRIRSTIKWLTGKIGNEE